MKTLYIDMDGVLVDLEKEIIDRKKKDIVLNSMSGKYIPGIFRNAKPIDGSIDAVKALLKSGKYDIYIASSVPWLHPEAAMDKIYWIQHYFGDEFKKRVILTHNKHLLIGDILVDDRKTNGAGEFKGLHIYFGTSKYPNWNVVLDYLLQ